MDAKFRRTSTKNTLHVKTWAQYIILHVSGEREVLSLCFSCLMKSVAIISSLNKSRYYENASTRYKLIIF